MVDPDTVLFYRSAIRPHTTDSEFDVSLFDSLPDVRIVKDYAGFDGFEIEDLLQHAPAGIVLETFAGGRMSAGARAGLRTAIEANIPVVVADRHHIPTQG